MTQIKPEGPAVSPHGRAAHDHQAGEGGEEDRPEDLLRVFDREALRTTSGDVFGRIYEYFLMKFAEELGI